MPHDSGAFLSKSCSFYDFDRLLPYLWRPAAYLHSQSSLSCFEVSYQGRFSRGCFDLQ